MIFLAGFLAGVALQYFNPNSRINMAIAMLFGILFRQPILTVTFIAGAGFEHARSPPWVLLLTSAGYWYIYPFCTPLYKIGYFMILAFFLNIVKWQVSFWSSR